MASKLLRLCKQIVKYADEGTPVKDAIEMSDYTTDELIRELAEHFVAWDNHEL